MEIVEVSTGHTCEYITPLQTRIFRRRAVGCSRRVIDWLRPALFADARCSPVTPPNKVFGRRRHIGGASSRARLYKRAERGLAGVAVAPVIADALTAAVAHVRPRPPFGRPRPSVAAASPYPRTVRRAVPLRRQAVRRAAMPLRRPVVAPAPVARGSIRALPDGGDVPPHPLYACAYTRTRVWLPNILHLC